MSNLATDTFTGANGAAWSSTWTTGMNPSAGAVTPSIQSNRGRLTTGSTGGYFGNDRIARRVNITAPVDAVFLFSFQWTTGDEAYPRFYIRSTNTALDTQGGYWFELSKANTYKIGKGSAYSDTDLGTAISKTWATNTKYWVRGGVVGTAIKMRVWNDGSSEPTTWDFSTTDSTHTTAGSGCGISVGGGALGSRTFDIDDFSLDTTFPVTTADSTSTLTNTATSTASVAKPVDSTSTLTNTATSTASVVKPAASSHATTVSATGTAASTKPVDSTSTSTVTATSTGSVAKPVDSTSTLTLTASATASALNAIDGSPLTLTVASTSSAVLAKPVDSTRSVAVAVTSDVVADKPLDSSTSLTVDVSATLSRQALSTMVADLTVISFAAYAELDVVKAVRQGGWGTLSSIIERSRQWAQDEQDRIPLACPNDGEPLLTDAAGNLRCRFDGWVWNGQPVRF